MTNYKAIVTLKNGGHKIMRMTRDVMAHMVSEFRKMQRSIFNDKVELSVNGSCIILNEIKALLFINEWTGERLEIV